MRDENKIHNSNEIHRFINKLLLSQLRIYMRSFFFCDDKNIRNNFINYASGEPHCQHT